MGAQANRRRSWVQAVAELIKAVRSAASWPSLWSSGFLCPRKQHLAFPVHSRASFVG